MALTKYTYDIASDFPGGKVNLDKIDEDIRASSIVTAFDRTDTEGGTLSQNILTGGTIDIWFKATLSAGDKTILDGDTTGPAGGLLATPRHAPTQDPLAVEVKNVPEVAVSKLLGNARVYMFSCDFTKKETWYVGSSGINDSFNADGVQKTFNLTHGSGNGCAVIDLSHGKVTDETLVTTPSGASYIPVVKINGAVQTEREMFEDTGGNYTIDYVAGSLTFFAAPPDGNSVTIDYYSSGPEHGPQILSGPAAGKKWIVNAAEAQFSVDIEMTDTLCQNVFLNHPQYGPNTPGGATAQYPTLGSFLDFTYGAFPIIPAMGGATRGTTKDTVILRWDYLTSIELLGSMEMKMKVWTKHSRGFSGERAVVTIYAIEKDE